MAEESQLFERFGRVIDAGDVIFAEGDEGTHMYIIQRGRVRIAKRMGGRDMTLAYFEKGDFFGEMAIVNRVSRTATATAMQETELLQVDRAGFQSMIQKNAAIAMNVIDKLCRRQQAAHEQMQHLMRQNSEGLVSLHLRYGLLQAGGSAERGQLVEEIALSLELPQDQVSAIIASLVSQDALAEEQGMLRIVDQAKLDQLVARVES